MEKRREKKRIEDKKRKENIRGDKKRKKRGEEKRICLGASKNNPHSPIWRV